MYQRWSGWIKKGRQPFPLPQPRVFFASADDLSVAARNTITNPSLVPGALVAQFSTHGSVLFSDEAVHRCRNLAQLSNAVVHLRLVNDKKLAEAANLTAAYEKLGKTGNNNGSVPCADLLQCVVNGLGALSQAAART